MRARLAASAVIVALLLGGTTGCTFMTPQATTQGYDASDGIGATLGDLRINNALLVTDGTDAASLIVSINNPTSSDISVAVQYTNDANAKVNTTIGVPANSTVSLGTAAMNALALYGIDAKAGSLFDVFFQYGDVTGTKLSLPVLAAQGEYADLVPSPSPTPTPIETPEPTPSPSS